MKKTGDKSRTSSSYPATLREEAEEEDDDERVLIPGENQDAGKTTICEDKSEAKSDEKVNCFGVKSYLHQFYDADDAEMTPGVYEDLVEAGVDDDDDFEYLVEPGKRRARWCYWFRWCIWCGVNLLIIGVITLLVGHLTPKREVVVDYRDHLEVLDRWAITFNQRLEFCRVAGLVIFCFGGFIVFVALLASTCVTSDNHGDACCCYERRDATVITTTTTLLASCRGDGGGGGGVARIPISEQIKSVQPPVVEGAGNKGGGVVVQMPYY